MNSSDKRKLPSIQLTPEIIISPRLYRFLERSGAALGGDVEYLLQEEYRAHVMELKDSVRRERRAAALGMSEIEYIQHLCRNAQERMAVLE